MKLSCDPGLTVTAFQVWRSGRPLERFCVRPKGDTPLAKLRCLCNELSGVLDWYGEPIEAVAIEDNGPKARAERREGVVRLQQCIATLQCFFLNQNKDLSVIFVRTGKKCAQDAATLAKSLKLKLNPHEQAALLVGYLAGYNQR